MPSPTLPAQLGDLYRQYGYRKFKMSKFEEYDLYSEYKSFLRSERIITFTGAGGKLLALKPDVTLSIIKNTRGGAAAEKVYYNENVYRVSPGMNEFTELTQVGLECVGRIDLYAMGEALTLAARSLALISGDWTLDISHVGFAAGLLSGANLSPRKEAALLECISRKNAHELREKCCEWGVNAEISDRLTSLISLSGKFSQTLDAAAALAGDSGQSREALDELASLCAILRLSVPEDNIRLDFSVVNDMLYYNGLIFQGYVSGVPASVLTGGRYDNLLSRMGKDAGAVGFAVYLDQLERLSAPRDEYDVDTLLLYGADTDAQALTQAVNMLTASGQSVLVQRENCGAVRCRQVLLMKDRGLEIVERND